MNVQAFYKALARVLSERTDTEIKVKEITDDLYALMRDGHYASIDMSNVGDTVYVRVLIMLNGLDFDKKYDYSFTFYMTEDADDLKAMNECKAILNNLLAEEQ